MKFSVVADYDSAGVYPMSYEYTDGYETISFAMTVTVNNINRLPYFSGLEGLYEFKAGRLIKSSLALRTTMPKMFP